jgi:hypothetical protein
MARVRLRESVRVLETAYDAGITHFDVARSYGYGAAESAVGAFAAGHRDRVTITTKFGIAPPARSPVLDAAKLVARGLVALHPGLRTRLRARAARMVTGGYFAPEDARRSLETSLRALRTDYVDLLLLHDCSPDDVRSPGLLDFLDACVARGQVRAFGVATSREAARDVVAHTPAFARVVQVPDDPLRGGGPVRTADASPALEITHSVLGRTFRVVTERLRRAPADRAAWSRALGADCGDPSVIGRLLLRAALARNPTGVVLFSSLREPNIQANAALGTPDAADDARAARLLALASSVGAPGESAA